MERDALALPPAEMEFRTEGATQLASRMLPMMRAALDHVTNKVDAVNRPEIRDGVYMRHFRLAYIAGYNARTRWIPEEDTRG